MLTKKIEQAVIKYREASRWFTQCEAGYQATLDASDAAPERKPEHDSHEIEACDVLNDAGGAVGSGA